MLAAVRTREVITIFSGIPEFATYPFISAPRRGDAGVRGCRAMALAPNNRGECCCWEDGSSPDSKSGRDFGKVRFASQQKIGRPLRADLCRSQTMLEGRCPAQRCRPHRLKVSGGSRGPRRETLRWCTLCLSHYQRFLRPRTPMPWLALLMNRDSRGSHLSVERRSRWLLVVIRTERLLFQGVEAIRERLEVLPVLRGEALGKLRNLHLALQ